MNEASSDARNSAALAISSGRPNRPMGMWTSRRWRRSGSERSSASSGVSIGPGQSELARIPCRAYSTASSRVIGQHSTLRGGIGDLGGGRAHQGDEGGHVHDRARRPMPSMAGHRGAAPEPHAFQVDLHDPSPGVGRGVEDAAVVVGKDPGVVEQHVEPAEGGRPRSDHGPDLVLVGHVDGDGGGRATGGLDARPREAAWSATTSATTTCAPSAANSAAATRPMPLPAPVITATLPSSRAITVLLSVVGRSTSGGRRGTLPVGRRDQRRCCRSTGDDRWDTGHMSAARPPPADRGLPCTARPPRGGRGSATPRSFPVVYLDCVEEAGRPAGAPAPAHAGPAARCGPGPGRLSLDLLDGLVLIGGGDIDTARVRHSTRPRATAVSTAARRPGARAAGRGPRARTCRCWPSAGELQILKSRLGGDLVQHLPDVVGVDDAPAASRARSAVTVMTEDRERGAAGCWANGVDVLCCAPPGHRLAGPGPGRHGPQPRTGSSRRWSSGAPVRGRRAVASRGAAGHPAVRGTGRGRRRRAPDRR